MNTGLWNRFKEQLWFDADLDVTLDVSRMDLDGHVLDPLRPAFERAFGEMDALEKGSIANPDEKRMVGHYWLRDPTLAPQPALADEITGTLARIRAFAEGVHAGEIHPPRAERFTDLLVIGIGGSALGPELVAAALASSRDRMRTHFIDNTDPDGIDLVLGGLGDALSRTLTVVISKSGGTPETRNGMHEAKAAYEAAGLELGPQAVAVTGEGSALEKDARGLGFLDVFPMWDWVGGRTSELSAVGLLPAALQGIDIDALLLGARQMDARTRVHELERNPAALLAASWYVAGEGHGTRDMVVLPYKDRLLLLSRYLQQLVMESLGKEKDIEGDIVHQGIVVYGNKGSTDQHAYVQQLRQGPDNFFVTFLEVLHDREGKSVPVQGEFTAGDFLQGFLLGTRSALYETGRRSVMLTIPDVSPRTLGMLIALFERAVGLYASLVGINAYNQPGVEAGKKAAAAVLDLLGKALERMRKEPGRTWGVEELAEELGREEDVETLFHVLRHAAANPDHEVVMSPGVRPYESLFSAR